MNWVEASVLVMLVFFTCVYLILVYLTSPRKTHREEGASLKYRPAEAKENYGSFGPRKLHGVRDEDLAEFVRNRLRLRPGLAGVEASVQDSVVRLSGHVSTMDERELAGNVARSVPQVKSVVNELRVRAKDSVA